MYECKLQGTSTCKDRCSTCMYWVQQPPSPHISTNLNYLLYKERVRDYVETKRVESTLYQDPKEFHIDKMMVKLYITL